MSYSFTWLNIDTLYLIFKGHLRYKIFVRKFCNTLFGKYVGTLVYLKSYNPQKCSGRDSFQLFYNKRLLHKIFSRPINHKSD